MIEEREQYVLKAVGSLWSAKQRLRKSLFHSYFSEEVHSRQEVEMLLADQSLCQLIILLSNRILLYGLRATFGNFFPFLTLQYRERGAVLNSS